MKKRIISVALVIVALLSVTLFQNTFAWFTVESFLSQELVVGDVNYTLEYKPEEDTREMILPGDEVLLGELALTNKSTIVTEIRFKVVDTVRPNDIDNFAVTFTNPAEWKFSETDGYYYYGTTVTDENGAEVFNSTIPEVTNTENGISISFIDSIIYNGEAIEKDEYSGKESTVTLKFQAKQGEYATWTDIGEFNI